MRFTVGARKYNLRIAPGPVELDGRSVDAATIEDAHEILIAASVDPVDRLDLLLREIARAWTYELTEPTTPEGWLNLAKTSAASAVYGLTLQGGVLALMSLSPGESPEPMAARMGLGTSRGCGKCGGTIAGGSVAVRPTLVPGVAELRLFCDHCGETQVWREAVNAMGHPLNVPLGDPRYERGDTTGLELPAAV